MRCWVKKVFAGELPRGTPVLIPAAAHDEEEFAKVRPGVDLRADIVQPRNPGLHRKAFALLKMVLPHTNYPNMEILRAAMTVGAGWVDVVVNPMDGKTALIPKSWEFGSMDNIEFEELYNRLVDVALRLVPNSGRDDWEQAEQDIARM